MIRVFHKTNAMSRRVCVRSVTNPSSLDLYDQIQERLLELAPDMGKALSDDGDGFFVVDDLIGTNWPMMLRKESSGLFGAGRFEQSFSEVADNAGVLKRVAKPGVFSLEMDGSELEAAPLLVHYTAALMHTLPQALNHYVPALRLSSASYGTKLAVTLAGSKYPKHVDNVGLPDQRKVTCILYLNDAEHWGSTRWGGELRVWGNNGVVEDVAPISDRLVVFLSDQVVHEVLPNKAPTENTATESEESEDVIIESSSKQFSISKKTEHPPSTDGTETKISGDHDSQTTKEATSSAGVQEFQTTDRRAEGGDYLASFKDDITRRFALTIWLVTENVNAVSNDTHPLAAVRQEHFPSDPDLEK